MPHTASNPVYVDMGTPNTQAPSSSTAFFFSLYLRLCSSTKIYKSGIQSKSILKVHRGPKRSEQAIYVSLWISTCPIFKLLFQEVSKGEKARRPKRSQFLFAMMVLQIHGFQGHAEWAGLLLVFCCCFVVWGLFSSLGMDRGGISLLKWMSRRSPKLTLTSAGNASQPTALLTLLSPDSHS